MVMVTLLMMVLLLSLERLLSREEGQEIVKKNAIRPADSFRRVHVVLETIVNICISIRVLLRLHLSMYNHLLRLMEHGMLGIRKDHSHQLSILALLPLFRQHQAPSAVVTVLAARLERVHL